MLFVINRIGRGGNETTMEDLNMVRRKYRGCENTIIRRYARNVGRLHNGGRVEVKSRRRTLVVL